MFPLASARAVYAFYERAERRVVEIVGRRVALLIGLGCVIEGAGRIAGRLPVALYTTAAQVLPVLMLVAIVEGRYFVGIAGREPFDRFFLRSALSLIFGGEAAALVITAHGSDTVVPRGLVIVAVCAAALFAWAYAELGPAKPQPATRIGLEMAANRVRAASESDKTDARH